jgi:hypothetical protein
MGIGLCGLPHVYDEEIEIEIWSKSRLFANCRAV